ncbi:MAG: serine/threonine-protein kinase, partial [Lysobacterales bacterium]
MNVPLYSEVKRLFLAARLLEHGARAAFLAAHCGSDRALQDAVMSMLGLDDTASPEIAHDTNVPALPPLPQIAGYVVERELARGGMGVVYLALRTVGDAQQRVALKLLSESGLHPLDAAQRFRAEGQILASLDHPNIARMVDAGVSTDGRAYLAMEFIEGPPIDRYCDEHALDAHARVALVVRVARAVAAAHRHLIVHRDLKPANILVDRYGEPKLLDFGIAKLLGDSEIDAERPHTWTDLRLMTARYAAPEQVRGEGISTATDVYALGVVLYELLAGASPYGAITASPLELPRAVCELEPTLPSTVVSRRAP